MKSILIYSIIIYIIVYIIIIIQNPSYLYDNKNNLKSFNYLNDKINNKNNRNSITYLDYINLALLATIFAISSFYISSN